ncbi:OmpH family outer membrane protein [Mucilaginibacter myungsuensis]|uniref:OmpH family outer membrane protein n=1 Tax=Mucilaginibacter myungsuensis TaxID=649104 RepID=A0A929KWN7_9SPHI|nr:OmpH family outer membrane protein [Mucilaginibacter myungsuensis]MBE9661828.1 OmpH family outer membrane protein [Mucilaginibacter myungsuensis]MDN3599738.1 OmpH family outer membrane protein [Mucilaginibacter myungsuensis]
MKKLLKSALAAAFVLMMTGFANAQTKIGHVNFQQLVMGDPQFKGIQANIDAYQKDFITKQQEMQTELQTKGTDYEAKRKDMTDAARLKAETELNQINNNLQAFTKDAQERVTAKSNELYKPLVDKMRAAIAQIAKEKGYAYVIDSSQTELLVSPEADDLMASVKAKVAGGVAPAAVAAPKK